MKIIPIFLFVAAAITARAQIYTRPDAVIALDESRSRLLSLILNSEGRPTEAIFSLSAELRGGAVEASATRRFIFDPSSGAVLRVEKLSAHQIPLTGYEATPLAKGLPPALQKSGPQIIVTFKEDTGALDFMWAANITSAPGRLSMKNCISIIHEPPSRMPSVAQSDLFEIKK